MLYRVQCLNHCSNKVLVPPLLLCFHLLMVLRLLGPTGLSVRPLLRLRQLLLCFHLLMFRGLEPLLFPADLLPEISTGLLRLLHTLRPLPF